MRKVLISFLICYSLIADTNATKEELTFRDSVTTVYHKFLNSIDCFFTNYDDVNQSTINKSVKKTDFI